jgi:hypothetical protein
LDLKEGRASSPRTPNSAAAVCQCIKAAIGQIRVLNPALGRYFAAAVATGNF